MPIPEFKIEVGAVPGLEDGVLLSFNGPIDARSIGGFEVQMNALRKRQFRRFLLQMGEVRYINSSGLAYLINMVESTQAAGGALVLFDVQPKVKVILESMGLTTLLRIYPSKASAVRDLKASAGSKNAPAVPAPAPAAGAIRRLFRKIFGPPGDRRL
ncbi:MAG TPA: STAS domain-containing protein [Planctomycetota bacterium]|nr:STAS domain-containing protein [Planctomycetota bacterium]